MHYISTSPYFYRKSWGGAEVIRDIDRYKLRIGNDVWIGQNAIILPGAGIGRNSIVGAGTVTSGQFGENLIIAGCPARVIRKQVCWSREDTAYFSYDTLEECASQEALKYL